MHARVSDLAESSRCLRFRIHRCSLSHLGNYIGTLISKISRLNTCPACAPVNASRAALRLPAHDSGVRLARYAFHVRLFHSQLRAGLSRRTPLTSPAMPLSRFQSGTFGEGP